MPDISIIIPIYNEEEYITKCLDSIIDNVHNKNAVEIILVDGESWDDTVKLIEKYREKYSFVKLIKNPQKIAPVAMNLGIAQARGKYIFIISAHAVYERNYFSKLVKYLEKLQADCVGPVLNTQVKRKTNTSNAIRNVLSDKLGVGSAFRSGVDKIKSVDTVAFGCYRREVFEKIGLYNEQLVRNQDIEFNKRLKKAGGKIYIIPEVKAVYFARNTFKELAKNNFQNGKWNILTAYYTKTLSSLSLRHFIPLFFILTLFLPLICCYKLSFILLFIYFVIIFIRSFKIKKETTLLHQIAAFAILHFSYGFGELIGLFSSLGFYIKDIYKSLKSRLMNFNIQKRV